MNETATNRAVKIMPPKPQTLQFHKRSLQPRLSPESAKRQGEITHLAFNLLGGSAPALGFLNELNDALDGRPIDVAIASSDGFAKVEQTIRQMAAETRS